jgi:hypothetical protein
MSDIDDEDDMTVLDNYDEDDEDDEDRDDGDDKDDKDDSDDDGDEGDDKDTDSDSGEDRKHEDDEYDQVPTFRQFEHIGETNELDIVAGFDLDPKNRRKMMANLSGEERFRKIANQYINENFKKIIDPSVIANLLENIKKIEYKNPKAFILGYYFISTGKKDKELSNIISEYIVNEEMGIDIKDIIRYVRLIRNSKK